MRLIQQRFGAVPVAYTQCIVHADIETLHVWTGRILNADNIDEIFN